MALKANTLVRSFAHAAGVVIYVAAVAWLMSHGEALVGERQSILMPVFALLLFIVSATITGLLVLGRPLQLYLDGAKREAVAFLLATLAWLVAFLVAVLIAMVLVSGQPVTAG